MQKKSRLKKKLVALETHGSAGWHWGCWLVIFLDAKVKKNTLSECTSLDLIFFLKCRCFCHPFPIRYPQWKHRGGNSVFFPLHGFSLCLLGTCFLHSFPSAPCFLSLTLSYPVLSFVSFPLLSPRLRVLAAPLSLFPFLYLLVSSPFAPFHTSACSPRIQLLRTWLHA